MKKRLYGTLVRVYITFRALISYQEIQDKTLHRLRRFLAIIEQTEPGKLDTRPVNGKWTGTEIAYHAATTSNAILRTWNAARTGSDIKPPGREAVGRTKIVDREQLIEKCRTALEEAERFDFSPAGLDARRQVPHPFLGPYNFKCWLVINLVHMERHFAQLKRVLQI